VRKQQPAAYMKICALLVPREMKVEHCQGGFAGVGTGKVRRNKVEITQSWR
jgi:hypothetical protein